MGDELTSHQLELVQQLKSAVAPLVQSHASLRYYVNEHTYVRYLRARTWHLDKALKMLQATLEWRLEFGVHNIRWDSVKHESQTGKTYLYHAIDKSGRPIVMMRPRQENTKEGESQIRHLVYVLEAASRLGDKSGVGKMTWLLDLEGFSMGKSPSLRTSMHCNSILQNHYPERLGCAVCYHAPSLFSVTWKAVSPFIDPVTKQKIAFIDAGADEHKHMESRFDMSTLEACMGGDLSGLVFDYDKYTARMAEIDKEMVAEYAAIVEQMKKEGLDPEPPIKTEKEKEKEREKEKEKEKEKDKHKSSWLKSTFGSTKA